MVQIILNLLGILSALLGTIYSLIKILKQEERAPTVDEYKKGVGIKESKKAALRGSIFIFVGVALQIVALFY